MRASETIGDEREREGAGVTLEEAEVSVDGGLEGDFEGDGDFHGRGRFEEGPRV
jgi:hypothetical protein